MQTLYADVSNEEEGLVDVVVPDRVVSLRMVPYGEEDVGDEEEAGGP